MSVIVTCKNCGQQVPWMSTHACRIKTPGFMAVSGPGFRVRPLFHEVRNLSHRKAEMIGDEMVTARYQATRIVEYDRRITEIHNRRQGQPK